MLRFVPPSPILFTMPRSASSNRSSSSSREAKRSRAAPRRSQAPSVAARSLNFVRPRSGRDVLTLTLALLGMATGAVIAVGLFLGHRTGVESAWPACILLAAVGARTAGWWYPQMRDLTRERVRIYLGSTLLLLLAFVISWHVLAISLGLTEDYLLPGVMNNPPYSYLGMALLACLGIILLLNLPVHNWLYTGIARTATATASVLREMHRRRTVHSELVPPFSNVMYDEEPEAIEVTEPVTADARKLFFRPSCDSGGTAAALPPIETFAPSPRVHVAALDVDIKAQRIEETLSSFGVRARVVAYHSGPVVTQFDVQPDRGVKVKSITGLQNDLALALAAPTIRIQAPVPGKAVVGIEIPNTSTTMVALRELLESDAYTSMKSPLSVVLGKDVAGSPAVIDLARMPHLLIAGATGSGKSVCVNALISCLLYRNTPDDVRLMMVDPKMVELTVYNGVPHLLSPVITQMDKVVGVLQWAIREMERRYGLFANATVRNIQRYNEKMEAAGVKKLPYIVVIVDELADLMMVAPEDVEDAICRLAQLARAAGIHLVIATQRPSVDVVTGLIKANFPARIAFAMTSQVDSRTILDMSGAEKLLGRGDMLYMPPDAPKPVRLQGAYLADAEIEQLVEFWQRSPMNGAVHRVADEEFIAAEKAAADAGDELVQDAVDIVREHQTASVSLLQRKLRIGYSRAARLMDDLEARGVVGPADGSKQRAVLLDDGSLSTGD